MIVHHVKYDIGQLSKTKNFSFTHFLLDCSKAFDTCKFSILFSKLLDRNVPPIVLRVLIVVYEDQYAWVKWGGARSSMFMISNGTKQGSVLSPS